MGWILYCAIVCLLISTSASEDSKAHSRRHVYGKVSNDAQKVYGPLVALGYLSKSVTDKCGNAGNIFLHLSKKKTATNLDELLGGLFEIVEATSEIVDGWIPELGKILKNMLISIVWVEACFPDSPLGKQLKGDLPAICAKEVSSHPGWEYFEEGFDSPLYTISYYRLAGIYDIIGKMLKNYGSGKNLDDLVGTPTIVGEAVVDIANVFKQDEMSWDLTVLSEVFAKFTTITAALAENSYKTLGVHVVDGIHKFCSGIGKDFGLDISPHLSEIKDKIAHSTCHTFENTLRKCVKNAKLNFDQFASAEDVGDDGNAAARMISNVMKAFDDTLNNEDDSSIDDSKSTGKKNKMVSVVFNVLRNFMRPNKDKKRNNRNNDEFKYSTERDVSFIDYDDLNDDNQNCGPSNSDEPESSTQAFIDVDETISLFEIHSDEDKNDIKHSPTKDNQETHVNVTPESPLNETDVKQKSESEKSSNNTTVKSKTNIDETAQLPNTKTKDNHHDRSSSEKVESKKPTAKSDDQINNKPSTNVIDTRISDKSTADSKELTEENKSKFTTSTVATLHVNNEKYTTKDINEYTEKPSIKLPIDEHKEHTTESTDKNKEHINMPSDKINEEKVVDETNDNNEHTKLSDNNGSDLNKSTTEKPVANENNNSGAESSEEDDDYSPFRFSLFPLFKGLMGSVATNNDKSKENSATKPTTSDLSAAKDETVPEPSTTKVIDDLPIENNSEENKHDNIASINSQEKPNTSDLHASKDQIASETSTAKATSDLPNKNRSSEEHKKDLASNLYEPEGHTITETTTAKVVNDKGRDKSTETDVTNTTPTRLDGKNPNTNNTSKLPKDKATETLPSVKHDKESSHESSNEKDVKSDSMAEPTTAEPIENEDIHQSSQSESEEYMPWYTQDDAQLAKVIHEDEGPKPLASLGLFSSSVSKACKKSPDLLIQLSKIETPLNFKEAINGIFGVVRAVSDVIDTWVEDLGTVLSNMLMAIVKIESCVPNSKYIKGISGTPCVCDKEFGKTWEWEPFQGTYDHALNVTQGYSLDRVWAKVSKLLEDHGKGKPPKDLQGTPAVLAQTLYQMSTIFRHASNWNHPVMTLAFVKFTTILGALGQSSGRPDLAETMVDEFIEYMSNVGKYYKIDLKPERAVIMKNIAKCTNNTLGGALILADDCELNSNENSGESKEHSNKRTTSEAKKRKPKSVSNNINDDNANQIVKPRNNNNKRVDVDKGLTEQKQNDKKTVESPANTNKVGDSSPTQNTITELNQSDENPTKSEEEVIKSNKLDSLEHIPFGKDDAETNHKVETQNNENENIDHTNNETVPVLREETKITSDNEVEPATTNQNVDNKIDTDCSDEKEDSKAKEKNALTKDNKNSKKNGLSLYQLLSNMFKGDDDESDESNEGTTTPAAIEDPAKARNDNTVDGSTGNRIKKQSKRDVDNIFERQTENPFQYETQMKPNYEDMDNNTKEFPENYIDNRIDVVGSGEYSTASSVPTEQAEEPFMAVGFVARGTSDKNMNWDDFLHSFFGDFLKTAVNQQPSDTVTVIKA